MTLWGEHGNPLPYSFLERPLGQKNLAGSSPWGHKGSDMAEQLSMLAYGSLFQFRSLGASTIYWLRCFPNGSVSRRHLLRFSSSMKIRGKKKLHVERWHLKPVTLMQQECCLNLCTRNTGKVDMVMRVNKIFSNKDKEEKGSWFSAASWTLVSDLHHVVCTTTVSE